MLLIGLLEVMAFGVLDHYVQGRLDAIGVYILILAANIREKTPLMDKPNYQLRPTTKKDRIAHNSESKGRQSARTSCTPRQLFHAKVVHNNPL